jgi:restriction system protein
MLMTVWVIRAGKYGERESWCLEHGLAGGGWQEIPSLADATTREAVRAIVDATRPDDSSAKRANNTGQLWGLKSVALGDIVIMPLKLGAKLIALGRASGGYQYREDPDPNLRHVIPVDWVRDDVPRTAIKDDLLFTLGAIQTIFKATRNEAEARFERVLVEGVDPGALSVSPSSPTRTSTHVTDEAEEEAVSNPVTVPTLETIRDRVRTHVAENFKSHALTQLVADVLRARGFVCDVSPPGPDQGVDILAGSGPLGLDSPTLIVEVKSETGQVSAPVVRGLQGAMLSNRADQGLLVAWGGISKDAKREIRTDRLTMRVWTADELLDEIFEVYERLPNEYRTSIPLKKAWVLDEEAG